MKTLYQICFLGFWGVSSILQNQPGKTDINKYIAAYSYIASDSINIHKTIHVSDTLVDLPSIFFYKELQKEDESEEEILKRFYAYPRYENCYLKELSELGEKKNTTSLLFFSHLYTDYNMICAELFETEKTDMRYNDIGFTQYTSILYLFIFDESNKVKEVYRKEMILN